MSAHPKTVLSNHLRVVSVPMAQMESVALGVWMAAGGRYESARLCGVSHFLEHVMFKGTLTRTARQIKEQIEGLGGSMNAFTDVELTCLYAKVPARHAAIALEVLLDMALHPRLTAGDIERERQVILEEIKMCLDTPMQYVQDLLGTVMWPRHPLGMFLAGTPASVRRIRRRDLTAYWRRFYTPANMVVAAAGPLSHRLLVEQVSALVGRVPPGRAQRFRRASHGQRRARWDCTVKDTEQTHAALGFHAFPRNHPHIHGLNLLHVILGGNMSSRLFHQVREVRGLAYDIGSQIKRYRDTGSFTVSAGVEPKKFLQALRVILEELRRVRREPVTSDEFARAQEFYTGQLVLALEDTVDHMLWVGESELMLERIVPVERILDEVRRARPADVTRAAREVLLPARRNLAVIGPVTPRQRREAQALLEAA
ncbi:MAG: insulinase family protein [Candidatus Omnitrophica bacterium]|nr:insulinase family protein [Candidatus Omnitrophota bacterium]